MQELARLLTIGAVGMITLGLACEVLPLITSSWIVFVPGNLTDLAHLPRYTHDLNLTHAGFMRRCYASGNCLWFNDKKGRNTEKLPVWHKVGFGFDTVGVVLLLLTTVVLYSPIPYKYILVLNKLNMKLLRVLGALTLFATLLISVAVALFIYHEHTEAGVMFAWEEGRHFGWGPYMALLGIVAGLMGGTVMLYVGYKYPELANNCPIYTIFGQGQPLPAEVHAENRGGQHPTYPGGQQYSGHQQPPPPGYPGAHPEAQPLYPQTTHANQPEPK